MFIYKTGSNSSQPPYTAPSVSSPIILDDIDNDETSGAIENDPSIRYYIEGVAEGVMRHQSANVQLPSSYQQQQRKTPIETIDLTSGQKRPFSNEHYLADECLERFVPALYCAEEPTPAKYCGSKANNARAVPEVCVQGILYKRGQSLELYDSSYLRITDILEDCNGSTLFSGRRIFRLKDLIGAGKSYLPAWRNELLWAVNDKSDVPLTLVKRFVKVLFTNHIKAEKAEKTQRECSAKDELFCRLKEVVLDGQVSIEYLSHTEADKLPNCQSEPWELRQQWRGSARLFGSSDKDINAHHIEVIDLERNCCRSTVIDLTQRTANAAAISKIKDSRQYSFGDAFCGAGGVSSGAQKAGVHIKWGFDKSAHAMETYRLNFKSAACEVSDIFNFLTNDPVFMRVDICHGSPPCQTFSAAKTVECVHDDANFACIFSCADLVIRAKPRVLTMEETSGLYERHRDIFCRVIQGLLEAGYSVGWKMLRCEDYGVPQRRRRLIIIASGPGESLPAFPRPSRGPPGSGLLPRATINSIITSIPPSAPDHDVEAALRRGLRREQRRPFDPDQQAMTITTSGGGNNYYPSGKRGFTNREFACLQTFDADYRFGSHEVRKQIGNAVPPILAKAIYREIIKSLKRTDSTEAVERMQRRDLELDQL